MHHLDPELRSCIDACTACHQTCLATAMGHCLELGGEHVAREHFTLMITCAEICQTAATFMLIGSPRHKRICAECAEICAECAADCERLGDMDECVTACRDCAESCRKMAA
ncbi:four-helix bundle copper-binding protein [Devosia nitrariae]|uniref:Ferredoxin n=1 Tax=Devosia nitrariae TaxID=2071872 RepID=A0ABQ5W4T4_9HYPH|nr:four-helix bundle copper-binding protein [Devosia nitrariae]GLQ55085.1 ferredoxin [Devosia nitrariae]